jgi:hypothetical protein
LKLKLGDNNRKTFQLLGYYQCISSPTITSNQPPAWFRAFQIGSGAVCLILSTLLITVGFPLIAAGSIILLLSIILFAIGIERVATGVMLLKLYSSLPTTTTTKAKGRSKKTTPLTNIGLGTLAIIFAIIAVILPNLVVAIPLTLLSIGISVMFNGVGRMMQGAFDRSQSKWFRAFSLGIGALSIGTSIFVTNSHVFGITFPFRLLLIVLFIYGIGMVAYGVTGKLSIDEILKKRLQSKGK